jgi:hypothetical protein
LGDNLRGGSGRIGDENHGAVGGGPSRQGVAGLLIGGHPIVDDAPDIAEEDVIIGGEVAEAAKQAY